MVTSTPGGQPVPAGQVHEPALGTTVSGTSTPTSASQAGTGRAGRWRRRRRRRRRPCRRRGGRRSTRGASAPVAGAADEPGDRRRRVRSSTPGWRAAAWRSTHSKVVRRTMSTARSSSPGCGSPRLSVGGQGRAPDGAAGRRARRGSGRAARRRCGRGSRGSGATCGAPRRSAANASSASAVGRQRVALEHGDLVTGPAERQRRGEPADAATDARPHDVAPTTLPRPTSRAVPVPLDLATTVARTLGYGNDRCQLPLTRRRPLPARRRAPRPWAGAPAPSDRRAPSAGRSCSTPPSTCSAPRAGRARRCGPCASAARLNPRYFYESFDDLDALVVAVYDRLVDEPGDRRHGRGRRRRRRSRRRRSRAAIDSIVGFVDDDRRRARVLYVEALGNEALNRRRIETGHALVAVVEQHTVDRHGPPPAGEQIGRIGAAVLVGGISELVAGVARRAHRRAP